MIIVNQEILGKELMTNQFKKFSKINIEYNDIHTLVYYNKIPKNKNLKILPNLKKLHIFSNDIMKLNKKLSTDKLKKFLSKISILDNLIFLSVLGISIHDENNEINCLNNLPQSLEFLEFSIINNKVFSLTNLPINLKDIKIDVFGFNNILELENNIKLPLDCDLIILQDSELYYRYFSSFIINQIR